MWGVSRGREAKAMCLLQGGSRKKGKGSIRREMCMRQAGRQRGRGKSVPSSFPFQMSSPVGEGGKKGKNSAGRAGGGRAVPPHRRPPWPGRGLGPSGHQSVPVSLRQGNRESNHPRQGSVWCSQNVCRKHPGGKGEGKGRAGGRGGREGTPTAGQVAGTCKI